MEDGPRLSSGRNLTWAADMPDDNTLVAGDWWTAEDDRPMVSLEDDYAYDLAGNRTCKTHWEGGYVWT